MSLGRFKKCKSQDYARTVYAAFPQFQYDCIHSSSLVRSLDILYGNHRLYDWRQGMELSSSWIEPGCRGYSVRKECCPYELRCRVLEMRRSCEEGINHEGEIQLSLRVLSVHHKRYLVKSNPIPNLPLVLSPFPHRRPHWKQLPIPRTIHGQNSQA